MISEIYTVNAFDTEDSMTTRIAKANEDDGREWGDD